MKFRYVFASVLLVSIPLLLASTAVAGVTSFCSNCLDSASAQQQAMAFRPQVSCDWPTGQPQLPVPPDLVCWSVDRDVILINPHTGQTYSYRLEFNNQVNLHVLVDRPLSADEGSAAGVIIDIFHALVNAEFGHDSQHGTNFAAPGFELAEGGSCPEGTALDHVLRPELRQWMFESLESQWVHVMAAFQQNQPRFKRTFGISATAGVVTLSARWDESTASDAGQMFRARFLFQDGEVPTSAPFHDHIVFDVHEFELDQNTVSMNVEYNESLSRAAGRMVPQLLSGQAVVDSPCVLQKLQEYQASTPVVFRVGGPGGSVFEFPEANPGAPLCTKQLCATVSYDGESHCQFVIAVQTLCD